MITALVALSALGCSPKPVAAQARLAPPKPSPDAKRVLVVMNSNSADGREVALYYLKKRGIPEANLLALDTVTTDNVPMSDYRAKIEGPVRQKIKSLGYPIDFIVTTKGVPIRTDNEGGYSVDAFLAAMDLKIRPIEKPEPSQIQGAVSPYFGKDQAFSSKTYGFYLVTRLDGYTLGDAKRLVDQALLSKPHKGPFLFDAKWKSDRPDGYTLLNNATIQAAEEMKAKGWSVIADQGDPFVVPAEPLAGYVSWGSNDKAFTTEAYRKLKFKPGAIAETFVSTSARTFARTTGGQSMIADLIAQGVTGGKGYVSEPYTFALARPEILFDRYTSGHTLAESFYMASPVLKWKDVVLGDPICRPYPKR
ncbi:MAG TPA: TIGR03790 family protein [Fimbriimonadaceae bacterium]|nr:TIGR03790 family protein [Fimbriimonadaceae bacterium]